MKLKNKIIQVLVALAFTSTTNATTFSADLSQSSVFGIYNGQQNAGAMQNINTTYDNTTQVLTWTSSFTPNNKGQVANGFWVIINDGPDPKADDVGELAIFYMDATDLNNPVLTAYAYNGQMAPVGDYSFRDGNGDGVAGDADFIFSSLPGTHNQAALTLTAEENAGETTLGFSVDLDDPTIGINTHNPLFPGNSPWEGAHYGDTIGFWYHPTVIAATAYNVDGSLGQFIFDVSNRGSFDGSNFTTTAVPEPSSVVLLLMGALAAGVLKRRA